METVGSAISILQQLEEMISQLSDSSYTESLDVFSGASIGQHTRHIIEFYQCLRDSEGTIICYDDRKRQGILETDLKVVGQEIVLLKQWLSTLVNDQEILLKGQLGEDSISAKTSVKRELIYVIEHAVHHMAIIKIGLLINHPQFKIPANFGIADSTVRYKDEQCAQ